jgi:serine/threonine-protein kinase HipA
MISDVRGARTALVYQDAELAGRIERTSESTVFEYDPAFADRHKRTQSGIALHLPFTTMRYERSAGALPPFFSNLLPEGRRLTALRNRVKTSLDDDLSLLLAAGPDPVGNVCVVAKGDQPWKSKAYVDVKRPEESDFDELFQRVIAGDPPSEHEPSIAGVQEKISGSMISMPVRSKGKRADYILKLNPPDKPTLVQNEHFFMSMAKACRLMVPPQRIVTDKNGRPGLLVERFDRIYSQESAEPTRLHVEDGCQVLNLYPAAKYNVSTRTLAEAVIQHVTAPAVDGLRFIEIVAFSYLIANGDLHAKNVSVMRTADHRITLTPVYDLLSTLPYADQHMALKFEGRDQDLRRKDFLAFGSRLGIRQPAIEAMLDKLVKKALPWADRLSQIGLDPKQTAHLERTMRSRYKQLSG